MDVAIMIEGQMGLNWPRWQRIARAVEDLGFAERGTAWKEVLAGTFALDGDLPVNTDGGLKSFGHPVGATGLMQAVFAFWQLQGTMSKHLGNPTLQLKNPRRGLIHSHAGTGTYITVSILEAI